MSNPRRYLQEAFEEQYNDQDPAKLAKKIETATASYEALLRERSQLYRLNTEPSKDAWHDTAGVQRPGLR